jgi:tripartite-type tricarboxylate transporter receptor subunit TctC
MVDTMFLLAPYINSGKLKALAQTGASRHPLLPNVPLVKEQGIPGFDATAPVTWFILAAPKATPRPIIETLNKAVNAMLQKPEINQRLLAQGLNVEGGTPEAATKLVNDAIDQWQKVITDNKISRQSLK